MATATKSKTATFSVHCPFCNADEPSIAIDLNDLTSCHCRDCDEEFSPAEALRKATEQMRKWAAVVRWTEMAKELAATL